MIDRIAFVTPINVNGEDLRSYVRTRDSHKIEVVDKGNTFHFWKKSEPGKRTRVPITNIVDIAEVVDEAPVKEQKK